LTRFRLLCVLATLLTSSSLFAAIKPPAEKEKWITTTSGEFRIYSNASARETRRIASDLVSMREALGVITKLKVRGTIPVNVFIFRDERSFAPYRDALMDRKNANFSGVFFSRPDANFVILRADARETERLVYHELTHYFTSNTTSNLPVWFKEGTAEYYSTFVAKQDAVEVGKPIPEHIYWLRNESLIPLQQLFSIHSRSPEYNETARQGVFYAQSWALMHYMLVAEDGARRPQVIAFLNHLAAGVPTHDAFQRAFKMTYGEMEQALRLYLRKPTMLYVRYQTGDLKVPEVAEPQPIPRAELLTALATLLTVNQAALSDADTLLNEAIRVDPASAAAYAQLGNVKTAMDDRTAAAAAYEKAVSLGSDAATLTAYGRSLLRVETRTEEDVKRARELLALAAQRDPDSPRALAGLGETYLWSEGDPEPGIEALEKSLKLAPSQEDVAMNLLYLYARAGRRSDAQRMATILGNSSDPAMSQFATEAVLRADVAAAEKLAASGKATEALALLERVHAETTSAPMKQQLEWMLANVRLQTQVERINVAIEHANKGRVSEAVRILEEVIPQMKDEEFKRRAEELRADWKKRLKKS
jgi:tetratricopeptide (TPR) repeat protein